MGQRLPVQGTGLLGLFAKLQGFIIKPRLNCGGPERFSLLAIAIPH